MYRKLILIFFNTLLTFPIQNKTIILLFFLSFALFFTIKYKPYNQNDLNILELQSNIASLVTFYGGSLYILQVSEEAKILIFLGILYINIIFTYNWISHVVAILIKNYENFFIKHCPLILKCSKIFKKIDTKFRKNFYFWFMVGKKKNKKMTFQEKLN